MVFAPLTPLRLSGRRREFWAGSSSRAYPTEDALCSWCSDSRDRESGADQASHVKAFQFFARYSAVRQASAWAVSVGLRAPLVPITEAPSTPRLGTWCEKPQWFTTFVSGLSPIRVPPYA